MKKERYNIKGMHCSNCSIAIENSINKLEGIKKVDVNPISSQMIVEYDEDKLNSKDIEKNVESIGYEAYLKINKTVEKATKGENKEKKILALSIILTLLLLYISMGAMMGLDIPNMIPFHINVSLQFIITIIVMILNFDYYNLGYISFKTKTLNMNTLIMVSTLASLILSIFNILILKNFHDIYFESIVTILTLVRLGKYLESRIKRYTSISMDAMINLIPSKVIVDIEGNELEKPIESIKINDVLIVKSGENIAADGTVVEGLGYINESIITGESKLVKKEKGDKVISGSILQKGYIKYNVDKIGEDTLLNKIINLVDEAVNSKPSISKFVDKVSAIFVPAVLSISFLTLVIYLLLGYNINMAIMRSVSVLVISCPCALGIATPISIMIGSYKSSSFGILFKNSEILEMMENIDVVLFDKTGTLTKGYPEVVEYLSNDDVSESIIYSIEKKSEHPLALAFVKYFEEKGVKRYRVEEFEQLEGKGIRAIIKNQEYLLGNEILMKDNNVDLNIYREKINQYSNEGSTVILLSKNKKLISLAAISDDLRDESMSLISRLKNKGIKTVMLTGDNKKVATYLGNKLGIDDIYSDLLPEDKFRLLKEYQKNHKVVMVGDGVNDAVALAGADVSISITGSTDVAIETSDVVLMNSNIEHIVTAINLSSAVIKNIKLSLFWAFIYNIIGIPMAIGLFGFSLNPMFAAFAMSMSSICVLINALTLNLFKDR
jgi:copper-exporting ATPase